MPLTSRAILVSLPQSQPKVPTREGDRTMLTAAKFFTIAFVIMSIVLLLACRGVAKSTGRYIAKRGAVAAVRQGSTSQDSLTPSVPVPTWTPRSTRPTRESRRIVSPAQMPTRIAAWQATATAKPAQNGGCVWSKRLCQPTPTPTSTPTSTPTPTSLPGR